MGITNKKTIGLRSTFIDILTVKIQNQIAVEEQSDLFPSGKNVANDSKGRWMQHFQIVYLQDQTAKILQSDNVLYDLQHAKRDIRIFE